METGSLQQGGVERLPSGRHRLTREAVAESQRGRLLFAMVQAVADKGYAATTVADVVEIAGVSRKTFYEQFKSKEECFLAAFDTGVEFLIGRMSEAGGELDEADWRGRMRTDLETYLEVLSEEPGFAWSLHVEMVGAGPEALKRRAELFDLFSARTRAAYERARDEDSGKPELPETLFRIHSGGVDELVRDCLHRSGPDALPGLLEPVISATLALFGDRPAAG